MPSNQLACARNQSKRMHANSLQDCLCDISRGLQQTDVSYKHQL